MNTYEPQLGTKLQPFNKTAPFGTVIAYGEADNDASVFYNVVIFMEHGYRIPSVINYIVCELHNYTGPSSYRVRRATVYANIVEAVNAYANDYGMDI